MRQSALTLAVLSLAACGGQSAEWKGWVYPDADDLTRSVALGRFRSLEECRAYSTNALRALSPNGGGDYECGLKCRPRTELGGSETCKETSR